MEPLKRFNKAKRALGLRGEIEAGELIKKSRKLSPTELAIRGLI